MREEMQRTTTIIGQGLTVAAINSAEKHCNVNC